MNLRKELKIICLELGKIRVLIILAHLMKIIKFIKKHYFKLHRNKDKD